MVSIFKIKIIIGLLFLSAGHSFAADKVEIHTVVFSDSQHFWSTDSISALSVGIPPVIASNYSESIPCDSCHWLSANGIQFRMENYLRSLIKNNMKYATTELIVPHGDLEKGNKVSPLKIMTLLDTLPLPYDKWFDSYTSPVIYRPGDRYTPKQLKQILNTLGGPLGHTHLLFVHKLSVKVFPKRSNIHQGKLHIGFYLIFWNVGLSYPEWIVSFRLETAKTDLDAPLEGLLDKHLANYLQKIPKQLKNLNAREPK
ncbi:MAG: hypothetical protein HQK83_10815 [Fibrobacteria bacterium]|nr:hypothetical protein [Fibrobacteria bacterium]